MKEGEGFAVHKNRTEINFLFPWDNTSDNFAFLFWKVIYCPVSTVKLKNSSCFDKGAKVKFFVPYCKHCLIQTVTQHSHDITVSMYNSRCFLTKTHWRWSTHTSTHRITQTHTDTHTHWLCVPQCAACWHVWSLLCARPELHATVSVP